MLGKNLHHIYEWRLFSALHLVHQVAKLQQNGITKDHKTTITLISIINTGTLINYPGNQINTPGYDGTSTLHRLSFTI